MSRTGSSVCHAERLPILTSVPLLARRCSRVADVISSNPKMFTSYCFRARRDLKFQLLVNSRTCWSGSMAQTRLPQPTRAIHDLKIALQPKVPQMTRCSNTPALFTKTSIRPNKVAAWLTFCLKLSKPSVTSSWRVRRFSRWASVIFVAASSLSSLSSDLAVAITRSPRERAETTSRRPKPEEVPERREERIAILGPDNRWRKAQLRTRSPVMIQTNCFFLLTTPFISKWPLWIELWGV